MTANNTFVISFDLDKDHIENFVKVLKYADYLIKGKLFDLNKIFSNQEFLEKIKTYKDAEIYLDLLSKLNEQIKIEFNRIIYFAIFCLFTNQAHKDLKIDETDNKFMIEALHEKYKVLFNKSKKSFLVSFRTFFLRELFKPNRLVSSHARKIKEIFLIWSSFLKGIFNLKNWRNFYSVSLIFPLFWYSSVIFIFLLLIYWKWRTRKQKILLTFFVEHSFEFIEKNPNILKQNCILVMSKYAFNKMNEIEEQNKKKDKSLIAHWAELKEKSNIYAFQEIKFGEAFLLDLTNIGFTGIQLKEYKVDLINSRIVFDCFPIFEFVENNFVENFKFEGKECFCKKLFGNKRNSKKLSQITEE